MGLDFIRTKGDRFVQKRDEARDEELNQVDLLTGTKGDVVIIIYRCLLEDNTATVQSGQPLILRYINDTEMHVLSRNRRIGIVLQSEIEGLVLAMRLNNHTSEFLSVVVVEGPGLDDTFTVKPKKPFNK